MSALLLLLAGLLVALPPASLEGQISGVVQDQGGRPLEGASVEAWGSDRRLATRVTGADGAFSFPSLEPREVSALYASRLGFRSARVELVPGVSRQEIRLVPEPIALPALEVEMERDLCTDREEDAMARRLWERMRVHYDGGLDSMGVATYLAGRSGEVAGGALGPVPVSEPGVDQRGSSFLLRVSWRRRIQREGYAYPVRRPTASGATDSWVYPPLQADLAPHFIDPLFGRLHSLAMLSEGGEGWTLAFCPRDTRRPGVQGTLILATDTSLVSAEWLFTTPEPREGAGGRALFGPPEGTAGERYLLPAEGIFWRRSTEELYQQTYERFEGWIVAPGDSVPFLPARRVSGASDR